MIVERSIGDLTKRRQHRYKELEKNNDLPPVKLAILGIEEGVNTLGWSSFFTMPKSPHSNFRKDIPKKRYTYF